MKKIFAICISLMLFAFSALAGTTMGVLNATGAKVTANLAGSQSATITLSGTFSETNQFVASADGTNWEPIMGQSLDGVSSTTATAPGIWQFSTASLQYLRVRCLARTSGSASVVIVSSGGSFSPSATISGVSIGTVNQGTGGSNPWQMQLTITDEANIQNSATYLAAILAQTSTAASYHSFISTASANLTNVKNAAGTIYGIMITNPTANKQYFKLYNKASAPDPSACSANSDCGVIYQIVPTSSTDGAGFVLPIPPAGIAFSTGIGYSLTGAACTVLSTCTDETASDAGIAITIFYK